MTLPDITDWQTPVAPTVNLIASVQNINALAFNLPIGATLLPQSTAVMVSVVPHAGNASSGLLWSVEDFTLSQNLTLGTVFDFGNPGMQIRPFPGSYVLLNPGNDLEVTFGTINGAVFKGDVYVYAVAALPVFISQVGLNGWSSIQTVAPVTVAAGATTTILAAPFSGRVNRILTLFANHVTAAAAVTRVSWINGIGGTPIITTFDTATPNFVWNNVGLQLDTTLDLQYSNGSSQPHQVGVCYQVGPE